MDYVRISDAHRSGKLTLSFELFPPRDELAEKRLFETALPAMEALGPDFMTCTYGAGGSTRDKTLEVVTRVKQQTGIEAACHLTCVGSSRDEIRAFAERTLEAGITNIVALRGDPPQGDTAFRPHPDGFHYAADLVRFLKQIADFDIAMAGYPEGHPECADKHLDWQRCRDKIEAGAELIITQLFYDLNDFYEFDDYMKNKLGVDVPIVPGILPILNGPQIRRFCGMCGAKLPKNVSDKLDSFGDDKASARAYGVELATQMCEALIAHGVPGFHFYTLNQVLSTREVLENLRLDCPSAEERPRPAVQSWVGKVGVGRDT